MVSGHLKQKSPFSALHLKNLNLFKILFILFFIGMICGTLLAAHHDASTQQQLSFLTTQYINKRADQSIVLTFFTSFSSSFSLLFLLFIFGFWAIGQPLSMIIPIFRGLGIGASMAQIYLSFSFKGILFCLILIVPHAIISTIAIVLAAKESIRFSNQFFMMLINHSSVETESSHNNFSLKLYITKFIVLIGILLLAALIDSTFTFLFTRFFY